MRIKRGLKNIYVSALTQIINLVLAIAIPRLVITGYGSEINGLLSTISNIYSYIALVETGIGTVAIQALYKPVVENDHKRINQILSATKKYYKKFTWYYFVIMLIASFLFPLIYSGIISYWTIVAVMLLQGMASVMDYWLRAAYGALLSAEGKNYVSNRIGMVTTITTNIAKIILVRQQVNIVILQLSYFFITMFSISIYLLYFKINYKWIDFKEDADMDSLRERNSMIIHQVTSLITNNTDTIVISFFCGLKYASVYSIYNLIFGQMSSMFSVVFNSVSFVLGQTYNENFNEYIKLHDAYKCCYCAVVFAVYSVGYILILPFISLYTSGVSDINYVDNRLPLLFAINLLLWNSRQTENNLIYVAGYIKDTVSRNIMEALINIVTSLILVQFLGIYGVLIGTTIAFAYRTIDVLLYVNHKILKRAAWRSFTTVLTNALIFGAVIIFQQKTATFFAEEINNYFDFVKYGFIITVPIIVVYIGLGFLTNKTARNYLNKYLLKALSNRKKRQ